MPQLDRRVFLVGAAIAGAGLAVGFDVPLGGPNVVRAADGAPEVNAWVVIRPDDTVVIRIARSEMGQGTLTGLAQLVAEELECDWSKVTTEYPTPGQSAARKRPWGGFNTGGSIGIRVDITDLKRREASFRLLFEENPLPMWVVDVDTLERHALFVERDHGALHIGAELVAHQGQFRRHDTGLSSMQLHVTKCICMHMSSLMQMH